MKRKTIKDIPIDGKDNEFMRIEMSYNEGGINFISGQNHKRGYYLSVQPIKKSKIPGSSFTTTSFIAFSGASKLIEEVKRFSQKRFDNQVEKCNNEHEKLINDLLNYVNARTI